MLSVALAREVVTVFNALVEMGDTAAAFVLSQNTVLTAGPFVTAAAVAPSPKTGRVARAAALCQSFAPWHHFWRPSAFWEAQARAQHREESLATPSSTQRALQLCHVTAAVLF